MYNYKKIAVVQYPNGYIIHMDQTQYVLANIPKGSKVVWVTPGTAELSLRMK